MASSTIFNNARIFTATSDDLDLNKNSMLVEGNLIKHVGSIDDNIIQQAKQSGASEVDLKGRLLAPGFIDSHIHITQFAYAIQAIRLEKCKNLEEVRQKIREGLAARSEKKRIFCHGWQLNMTEGKALASDLDDLDPRPMFISARDLHSAWCNTAALNELNIDSEPDPPGGEIRRDEAGKPSGLLSETASIKFVWPHQASVISEEEKLDQICAGIKALQAQGYTGAIEMATDDEIWALLTKLESQGRLSFRFAIHWIIKPSTKEENLAQVDRAIELFKRYNLKTSPNLRIAGIKLICDGLIDTCTAHLREPFLDGSIAEPIWPYDQILPVIQRADAAGLQCALHAIGDGTVRNAIDALSTLVPNQNDSSPKTLRDKRHRIEHLELTHPSDAERLGKYGITASIQPFHADPSMYEHWPPVIGKERCARGFAYSEFAAHGAPLAIGTDSPTAGYAPLRNLYAATTRRSARDGKETDPATMNEWFKIGLGQSLRAATFGGAYSCFADATVGTLEAGKLADFVVMDLEWDEWKLLKGVVEQTWLDGKRVF